MGCRASDSTFLYICTYDTTFIIIAT
ncbi:hypothetical protein F383_38712 [Gossypium arboreum]|uniref:Uncharacterized protein n=1 Tax=Gossypium arboreum TaxID=29729 RepID=A0A0B0MHX2_GOSAR|nr:hypothetical protein F383_38712 [Gossypium arboreum]